MRFARYTDGELKIPVRIKAAIDARTMVYAIADAMDPHGSGKPPTSRRAAVDLAREWIAMWGWSDEDAILSIDEAPDSDRTLAKAAEITARLFPEWEHAVDWYHGPEPAEGS